MKDGYLLVLEDDLTYQTLLQNTFDEYEVLIAGTLKEAVHTFHHYKDELKGVIVDLQLPDGSGLQFLDEVSQDGLQFQIPCIVLSGRNDLGNKVSAFTLGAEDFVEKPFHPIELKARLKAKIEKFEKLLGQASVKKIANLIIDIKKQKAFLMNNSRIKVDLQLTLKEFQLLLTLTTHMGQVYSRDQLLDKIWGDISVSDRTVDSHMAHLRKKIEDSHLQIKSLKGLGYFAEIKS